MCKQCLKDNTAGIDYSCGLGSNRDLVTGIHYGVISVNEVCQDWLNEFDPVYPDLEHSEDCKDPENCDCGEWLEAFAFTYDSEGIQAEYSSDSPYMFIFKSPTVINCKFCSPCMPGAGDLGSLDPSGIQTYGLAKEFLNQYQY